MSELPDPYLGTQEPVRKLSKKERPLETVINGVKIYFLPVRKVAARLHRTAHWLRILEYNGVVPKPFFSTPAGARRYTLEECEVLVRVFNETGVRNGVKFPPEFQVRIHAEYAKLRQKFEKLGVL